MAFKREITVTTSMNLSHLDMIALAETKLDRLCGTKTLEDVWVIVGRYDAPDEKKHMGMLLLLSQNSKFFDKFSITY